MNPKILNFLKNEKLCVLSVLLEGNQPYGAVMHYSVQENPLKLYIQTSKTTTKAKPFLEGGSGKAAVTIGFNDHDWVALQMTGNLNMVSQDHLEEVSKIHYLQHPGAEVHRRPDTIFLEFVPTGWKYTDFKPTPITILKETSE